MRRLKLSAIAVSCAAVLTCAGNSPEPLRPERTKGPADDGLQLVETAYDHGFKGEWQDFGWSRREMTNGQPARVDMSDYGGWIMARPGLSGDFRALFFRMKSAKALDFLVVAASAGKPNEFPDVTVTGKHLRQLEGGEVEALIPMKELNPANRAFDRLVFRAGRPTDKQWVEIDAVTLWGLSAAAKKVETAKAIATPARRVAMTVACNETGHAIPEMVYGIAYYPMYDARDQYIWSMNPPARRWGGNHTSRYNWKVGNAFNTASDWFFKNVSYVEKRDFTWADFLLADQQHGAKTALTVPTIGWVAKDTASYSFPVATFGQQQQVEPGNPDVGNGVGVDGKPLKSGPPTRTSVAMPPEDIGAWVMKIRERDAKMGQRSVHEYILDNEPELWHVTHRDVHPEPPSYDELLQRNVAYAKAVRAADPEALIAGPASWGWTGYWWSAVDQVAGFTLKPDRRKHGDVPFLAWYLREMKKEEQKTGKRLLDVVDVHFYPQGEGLYSARADADAAGRRIRSTRSLWDPTYKDESWINETIELLPRFERLLNENYPGTKLSIGEWNFGGEAHISGALAMADALGRFGQSSIMASAFYWTYPAENTPAYWAYRAYRNYDGKNAHFLEESVPVKGSRDIALFASRDSGHKRVVAIAINSDSRDAVQADVTLNACGAVKATRAYRLTEDAPQLSSEQPRQVTNGVMSDVLPPQSITVYELEQ